MAEFEYTTVTAGGQPATARLRAASRDAALAQLAASAGVLTSLRQVSEQSTAVVAPIPADVKVSSRSRETFIRQLAALLSAGVPLATAMNRLARETGSAPARLIWQSLHDQVADGVALAEAMSRYPHTFPTVYTAMVHAGETGGFLGVVLAQIAEFQSRDREVKSRAA